MPARPDGDGRNVHGRDGGGDGGGDAHGSDGGGDGGGDNRGRGDSTAALQLPAPGKINRYLRVLGRREDGFHEIETQFQFIAWADRLTFEALDSPQIRRIDRHDFALPAEDLCVRAARLLQAECPAAAGRGAVITVRKTIPPGSGLGGGSSNAATTLLALNRLWQLGLPRDRLAELGLRLGADVPLFVRGRAALARGIGEKLTPQAPAEKYLCICIPAAVSTAQVFAEFRPADCGNRDNSGSGNGDRDPAGNDLESAATRLYPAIGDALAQLRSRGMNA
ncbi:MAG: 4-(cytidine 5'-diphospho)-2-C-methyl-D-erythritol kinase, partial [Gammaproteobacteria bacterium]|nr:4-(cytidine 5'-diphospho)-2-C-methyl-D-erythritol kinase [Gammaproteobacteria bacterium]